MTAAEQPTTGHILRVFFDQDAICSEVVCFAPPDADCRLSCDEGCEEWGAITRDTDGIWHYVDDDGTGHWQDKGHRMHVVDYCNVCEFINNDGAAEFGSGTFEIAAVPIAPQWEGDYYSWSATPALASDKAAAKAEAQIVSFEEVPLAEGGQANYCEHLSATGIDTTPIGPGKVWACDHCGLQWTDARTAQAEALREAAAWVADSLGYPVETKMPEHPMPQALWDALVGHVHADVTGNWHGNTLDREETESWLADEAGRRADRVEQP